MTDTVTPIKSDSSSAVTSAPEERISEQDKHVLDLVIMQHKLSIANAEKALAENKASESTYRLTLFQLYVKYGLSVETDAIDEQGTIKRNAVAKKG